MLQHYWVLQLLLSSYLCNTFLQIILLITPIEQNSLPVIRSLQHTSFRFQNRSRWCVLPYIQLLYTCQLVKNSERYQLVILLYAIIIILWLLHWFGLYWVSGNITWLLNLAVIILSLKLVHKLQHGQPFHQFCTYNAAFCSCVIVSHMIDCHEPKRWKAAWHTLWQQHNV